MRQFLNCAYPDSDRPCSSQDSQRLARVCKLEIKTTEAIKKPRDFWTLRFQEARTLGNFSIPQGQAHSNVLVEIQAQWPPLPSDPEAQSWRTHSLQIGLGSSLPPGSRGLLRRWSPATGALRSQHSPARKRATWLQFSFQGEKRKFSDFTMGCDGL